jgi:hypothetical protein
LTVADDATDEEIDVTIAASGGGGGGGGLVLIDAIELVATGEINFTSIPNTYTDLLVLCHGRSDRANATDQWRIQVGGSAGLDTGANYRYASNRYGTNGGNAQATGAARFEPDNIGLTGAPADAGTFGFGRLTIYDYADDTRYREVMWDGSSHPTSTVYNTAHMHGQWRNAADAVERIRIWAEVGDLVTGSRASLYGIG